MKEKTEKLDIHSIEAIRSQGVKVQKAWFKQTVRNENHFALQETRPDRQATMTLTPLGLLIEQKGKKPAIVPHANLIWCDLLFGQ